MIEYEEYEKIWESWKNGNLTHIVETRIMKMSRSEIIGLVIYLIDYGDGGLIDDLKSLQTMLINRDR